MKNRIQLTQHVDAESLKKVDEYAKKIGISRTQLINNLIDSGLDDLYILEKTGFLSLSTTLRSTKEKIRQGKLQLT